MCEPISMTTMFMAATAASAAVGAYSSIQQGRAQYKAEMYNAEIQKRNAAATEREKTAVQDAAAIERRKLGERVRAERGEYVAKAAAMGIDGGFGTTADLVGDIKQAYNIDSSILGKNEITALSRLDKEQADYLDAARMSRSSGKGALKAGYINAAGSLFEGAAGVSNQWIQPGGTTPTRTKPKPTTRTPSIKVGAG